MHRDSLAFHVEINLANTGWQMAVVWIAGRTVKTFEDAGKLSTYLKRIAVNGTAFRRKLRAGQVTSGQVRSGQVTRMLAASRLVLCCCPFLSLRILEVHCLQLAGLLCECEVWAVWV